MKQNIIKIPTGIQYLSDFKMEDGAPFQLPNGILNKELTGCGGTTLALEDENKTIICSPRIRLLENKKAQYPSALLVKGGINKRDVAKYLEEVKIPKVLTTYDSLWKVIECIEDMKEWRVVVDEFQCILNDASFKADTELRLLEQIKSLPYVTFLSATPILDKYIEQIPSFNNIPYYKLEWEDKYKVNLHRVQSNNPIGIAQNIVRMYKNGKYPKLDEGNVSKECVIFLNSVTGIVNIIKNTKLQPEEVNIIVANNEDNDAIIKKLGEGYGNGTIPLKGEKHKLITLCTSTAYMGVDFYSTCATTFVISDCKMINTSVDVSTELAQIAGRQRLATNPFRNHIYFVYKTSLEDVSAEEFEAQIEKKKLLSEEEIASNNNSSPELKEKRAKDNIRNRKIIGYSETYSMYNENTQSFTYNKLAEISDRFAFDVQKYNYQNGVMIKKQLESTGKFDTSEDVTTATYNRYVAFSITNTAFIDRMNNYCELMDNGSIIAINVAASIAQDYPELKVYYNTLGSAKIKALGYQESKLKSEYQNVVKLAQSKDKIAHLFKDGTRIPKTEIKARLQLLYNEMGLKKTAKATDITKYGYSVKDVKIATKEGRLNGFELTKI